VATISSENGEIGKLIADVINEVGKDGVITVEESQTFGFSKEVVEGLNFDKGYISPYMITDSESLKAEMKDPWIIITDKKISGINEILPLLEKITASGKKDIVIIADEVEGEALATLVVNKLRGIINVLAVKAPEFGDTKKAMLEDIAVLTGGKVITEEKGMKFENTSLEMLGHAAKIVATKDSTTIISGKGKKKEIESRINQIKSQVKSSDSQWDKDKLKKRLAKLSGGVAIIKVGAATEAELTYLKHKTDDALAATKAAVEEGIVIGGGTALLRATNEVYKKYLAKLNKRERLETAAINKMDLEYDSGFALLVKALEGPARQIVLNAGQDDPGVVINKIKESRLPNFGYDASKESFTQDMIKAGIVDPLKVTRTALENAVSMAAMLLTSEVAIAEKPEKAGQSQMPSMPGMGGMM
jgi:chaperonin GroEL